MFGRQKREDEVAEEIALVEEAEREDSSDGRNEGEFAGDLEGDFPFDPDDPEFVRAMELGAVPPADRTMVMDPEEIKRALAGKAGMDVGATQVIPAWTHAEDAATTTVMSPAATTVMSPAVSESVGGAAAHEAPAEPEISFDDIVAAVHANLAPAVGEAQDALRTGTAGRSSSEQPASDVPVASASFLCPFFDELYRMGVRHVVVSPGSRSTPLAMVAFDMSKREGYDFDLTLDVDERGAAFFALGIAKATGKPACLVCTSGTATANYYPAVLEAESSRVPLIVLTGDRPPRLQDLGAPQTCNQEKLYGDHVRSFRQMPLPAADAASIAFARQAAREAYVNAVGGAAPCSGGPVHLNFPFEEPLKPDLSCPERYLAGRSRWRGAAEDANVPGVGGYVAAANRLSLEAAATIDALLGEHRVVIMAGEGSVASPEDADALMSLAASRSIPVLADPLSNLRSREDALIIDGYDAIFGKPGCPELDLVVRFGRYPISKKATMAVSSQRPLQIVVDPMESRDFNCATDVFVRMAPADFVAALDESARRGGGRALVHPGQEAYAQAWMEANAAQTVRAKAVSDVDAGFEGAYVRAVLKSLPGGSLLFAANSMSVRWVDTFLTKGTSDARVLCNRGLNGIDGTVSTALGAACSFSRATLITGDLTLLHDVSALGLQRELRDRARQDGRRPVHLCIVLLNNHGGGIFDMLPQKSEEEYFERLFLTPQSVDFGPIAAGFDVPYARVTNVEDLRQVYAAFVEKPGITLIEADVPLTGLKERSAAYW